MLVYLDSSVLARAYLPDEVDHKLAVELLTGAEPLVTSSWTVVEVTSALVRAARGHRVDDLQPVLDLLAADVGEDGPVTLLRPDTAAAEQRATELVRAHPLRSLDALHLAVAELAAVPLLDEGTCLGFAGRDDAQRAAAETLGFAPR